MLIIKNIVLNQKPTNQSNSRIIKETSEINFITDTKYFYILLVGIELL